MENTQKNINKNIQKKDVVIKTTIKSLQEHLFEVTKNSSLVNVLLYVTTQQKNKTKIEAVKKATELCTKFQIKKTKQQTTITEKNASTLLNAICRDINNVRKGWWNNYIVIENENEFKLALKEAVITTA